MPFAVPLSQPGHFNDNDFTRNGNDSTHMYEGGNRTWER